MKLHHGTTSQSKRGLKKYQKQFLNTKLPTETNELIKDQRELKTTQRGKNTLLKLLVS
jgi:hypothetical protein